MLETVGFILACLAIIFGTLGFIIYWRNKKKKEVEMVEDLETVNRPLTDFRSPSQKEEELFLRVQRLENAVILIEQAFGWVLIPKEGEEEIVTVVERINPDHIEFIPAILIDQGKQEPIQPEKPIRPRFVQ